MSKKKQTEKEEDKESEAMDDVVKRIREISIDTFGTEPNEILHKLSSIEFAKQILGSEIMKWPNWPNIWCRILCWIKYMVCVSKCSPFLRDVIIREVGRVESENPLDKASKLLIGGKKETPVGGRISISGSANITGAGREITRYSLWYAPYDVTLDKWMDAPPDHTPLTGWSGPIKEIEYISPHEETWSCGFFSGSNIISNGDLTSKWRKFPCPSPQEVWMLKSDPWNTIAGLGSGRFTLLLMVEDNLGGLFYDSQRVWIDNKEIECRIMGIAGLKPCQDLKMSLGKVAITGEAYDPPIDETIAPIIPPNDNFRHYKMRFRKQGAPFSELPQSMSTAPVGPPLGTLYEWDLKMLDKDTNPLGLPENQLLARKEACPYIIELYVCDYTHVNDSTSHHHKYDYWAVKILNDLGGA